MARDGQKGREEHQPYHHGDLRVALLAAALQLIDEHGVKSFSLKDAAKMAGVSTAAPYRHFADKEAVIRAILVEGYELFNESLAEAYAKGKSPQGRITELGVAYVRFAEQHPAHFRVMFGLAGSAGDQPLDAEPTGFLLLVEGVEALLPGASGEQHRDLVVACWSVVHGFAMLLIDGALEATMGMPDAEKQLRRTLGVMISGTENAGH